MAVTKEPNPSDRRKSILVYPDVKEQFDEIGRELKTENQSQTLERLMSDYRERNRQVRV